MEKPENTDKLLFTLIIQGDKIAYSAIFRKYYKDLTLFAFSFVKDKELAEDIVQDFYCKLWENHTNLSPVDNCKGYLYNSIRNYCLNYTRDKKIDTGLPVPEDITEENILDLLIEEEIYKELTEAIKLLPGKCREVFLMKLNGSDNIEIATHLNITEDTVRSQFRRGKELLRTQLHYSIPLILHWLSSIVE